MTRDPITDPEVLADLGHRARSERDTTRSRETAHAFGDAAIVEHWPCRKGCGAMVGVTRAGIDARETCNRRLATLREPPIGKHQVMWCPSCKRVDEELARAQRRPHEQRTMPGIGESAQRPSGMQTTNRRRSL
jgi:hypothetical protein